MDKNALDVACISNGAPHAVNAKRLVEAITRLPSDIRSYAIRTWLMWELFNDTETLRSDISFEIDQYGLLLDNFSEKIHRYISYAEKIQSHHMVNLTSPRTLDSRKVTQNHYGDLFSNFSKEHYFDEPWKLLATRLQSNNISFETKDKLALDAGCGGGRYTYALAQLGFRNVIGLDFSPKNIETAQRLRNFSSLENVSFVQGDVLNLPFADASFDFVFSNGVLHHTSSIEQGLREIKRVLRNKGQAFLYLIESPGGIHWDSIEICRVLMSAVPHHFARDFLRSAGLAENRIFYILDHIMVPINTRLTQPELEELIDTCNLEVVQRLEYGAAFDRITQLKDFLNLGSDASDALWKFGIGEHRYILR